MKWFKKCKHEWEFVTNLYGDTINMHNCARSKWMCTKCGKIEYRGELYPEGKLFCKKLDNLYDEFYENKYEAWKKEHKEMLEDLKNNLIKEATCGVCWYDTIFHVKEETDDRYYLDTFLKELGLEYSRDLPGKKINEYDIEYHIRWKV